MDKTEDDRKMEGSTETETVPEPLNSKLSDNPTERGTQTLQLNKIKRADGAIVMSSMPGNKKVNPFKFFEETEDLGDPNKAYSASNLMNNVSLIPVTFGERIDESDLVKAKYLNPTKRRKMSFSDFEKRVEEGNLILLDLIISCKGERTIMEYLENQIGNVFEVTKTFEDGTGFLVYAIQRGFEAVIEKLISLNLDILKLEDEKGRTALHYACMWANFEVLRILLENGADIDHRDKEGNVPLHYAILYGKTNTAVYLASVNAQKNAENIYGLTPLDYAKPEDYLAFSSSGFKNGQSGFPPFENKRIESSFKRRWDLNVRLKVIKGLTDNTTFQNCYIERDKGRIVKNALDSLKLLSPDQNEEIKSKENPEGKDGENKQEAKEVSETNPTPSQPQNDSERINAQKNPETHPSESLSMSVSPEQAGKLEKTKSGLEEILDQPINRKRSNAGIDMGVDTILKIDPTRVTCRDYLLKDVIGSGSFGEVYLVSHKKEGKLYAMKVYSKQKIIRNGLLKFLFLEKRVLMNFDHPFIVKVYTAFQTPKKLYLVMDYCRFKDFGQYLTKFEKISEFQARILIAEIVLAVEELHRRKIIHRDLKPDNILIDEDGHVKIADFGLSKDKIGATTLTNTFCGSIAYLPPEVVKREGHGQPSDWYLVGELLYESIFGIPPFFHTSKKVLLNSIITDEVNFPNYINRTTKDLILNLLEKDPSKRIGSKLGAREIKNHPFFKGVNWEAVYHKKYKLFNTSEIQPYQWESHDQEIIDRPDPRSNTQRIMNWSISR